MKHKMYIFRCQIQAYSFESFDNRAIIRCIEQCRHNLYFLLSTANNNQKDKGTKHLHWLYVVPGWAVWLFQRILQAFLCTLVSRVYRKWCENQHSVSGCSVGENNLVNEGGQRGMAWPAQADRRQTGAQITMHYNCAMKRSISESTTFWNFKQSCNSPSLYLVYYWQLRREAEAAVSTSLKSRKSRGRQKFNSAGFLCLLMPSTLHIKFESCELSFLDSVENEWVALSGSWKYQGLELQRDERMMISLSALSFEFLEDFIVPS